MKQKVLLLSPRISDMYLDIISQLEQWDMEVDYIEDYADRLDPNYMRSDVRILTDNFIWRKRYSKKKEQEWKKMLAQDTYNKKYDFLLVIDGQRIHPYIFDELRRRNPNLWAANYLYDSTKSLYRFQMNFMFFNRVASFDKRDCKKYGLSFLPIYWCEPEREKTRGYDLFGFGGYGPSRYNLYMEIDKIAKKLGLDCYAKLFVPEIMNFDGYQKKRKIRKLLGLNISIAPEHYLSDLIVHKGMSSSEFRKLTYSSKITIDSVNFDQDGMTARFMWAWGAGRKIITTNSNIKDYDSYDPMQIFVVDDINKLPTNNSFLHFIKADYIMPKEKKKQLLPWRIDNWLKFMLNL